MIIVVVVVAVDEENVWIRRRPWKNSERGRRRAGPSCPSPLCQPRRGFGTELRKYNACLFGTDPAFFVPTVIFDHRLAVSAIQKEENRKS